MVKKKLVDERIIATAVNFSSNFIRFPLF